MVVQPLHPYPKRIVPESFQEQQHQFPCSCSQFLFSNKQRDRHTCFMRLVHSFTWNVKLSISTLKCQLRLHGERLGVVNFHLFRSIAHTDSVWANCFESTSIRTALLFPTAFYAARLLACLPAYFPCLRVLLVMRKRKNAIALRFACDVNIYTFSFYIYVYGYPRSLASLNPWWHVRWYVSIYEWSHLWKCFQNNFLFSPIQSHRGFCKRHISYSFSHSLSPSESRSVWFNRERVRESDSVCMLWLCVWCHATKSTIPIHVHVKSH